MVLKLLEPLPAPNLSDRQRAILRGYFEARCRTGLAARRLGISPHRISEVKALPAASNYLNMLEEKDIDAIIRFRVAMALEAEKRP